MTIGNFQDPSKKTPETSEEGQKAQPTPAKRLVDSVQNTMETNVSMREGAAQRSDDWKDKLKAQGVSVDKAGGIIDDMLTQGYYEESYNVTKRVKVRFRSRSQGDYRRYLRALDIVNPRFNDEMQEIAMRYFIAASIVSYHGTEFFHPDATTASKKEIEEAFEERVIWVEKQPAQVMVLLSQKLRTFDEMLATVFSEGVIENF